MFRRYRQRRWIALIALFGLLFQQFAMAAYLCPRDLAAMTAVAEVVECHSGKVADVALCHEHCHPTTGSVDQTPALGVPPLLLPPSLWTTNFEPAAFDRTEWNCRISARSKPPPLTVQYCTFQI